MKSILTLLLILCLGVSVALNIYLVKLLPDSAHHDQDRYTSELTVSNTGNPYTVTSDTSGHSDNAPINNRSADTMDRASLTDQLELWLASGQYAVARDVIQRHLQQSPQDVEFLLLEARLIDLTADIAEVLAHYYGMLDLPLNDAQLLKVQQRIKSLTSDNVSKLKGINAWDILATFLEPLWQYDPTNKEVILVLAEAYARLESESLMEYVLASLLPDDPDAIRIRSMFQQSAAPQNPTTQPERPEQIRQRGIALARRGDHFLVDSQMGGKAMRLMIDTGASTTVLTSEAFARLPGASFSEFVGNYQVNTAGGLVTAPIYRVQQLSIAEFRVNKIAVVVLPMEAFNEADGLLGMNFLREFDFWIDQKQAQLYLR